MSTSTIKSPVPNQINAEQQADRMLAQLRAKPDTGIVTLIQGYQHQHQTVQQVLLRRLAMHYASSNSEHYRRLEQENKRLKQPPHQLGILEEVCQNQLGERLATVSTREGLLEVAISEDVADEELIPGYRVLLAKSGTVIGVKALPPACPASEFARTLPDDRILAQEGNQYLVLAPGGELFNDEATKSLKAGDLLEYEPSTRQAIRIAQRSIKTREFVGEPPDATWEDVGGLDEIRETIEKEVLGPILHREIYERYGVRPVKGILFEGAPGVGKTLLVKALGTSLLSALQLKDGAPVLFKVKATALQSSYVGEGPARVRALAATAKEAAAEHGLAIIMLDDFEYGGGLHRGVGDRSSPAYSNLTATLISEMEGLDNNDSMIVWAATANRSDLLDSALLRPGRFGKKITVPRPGPEASMQILLVHLRNRTIAKGVSKEELAEQAVERLFACDEDNLLMRVHFTDAGYEEIFPLRIISGAIIAEAVRSAALQAICRDLSKGASEPEGIQSQDLIESLYEQLNSAISSVRPSNAHLHYLDLPDDQRVVAVEHVWQSRHGNNGETF